LTLATFAPAVLTMLALPLGFIDEGVAVVAGFYACTSCYRPSPPGALTPFGLACRVSRSERWAS
jgi:hypothetical protein